MKASPIELQIIHNCTATASLFQASRVGERPRVAMEQKTALVFWKSGRPEQRRFSKQPLALVTTLFSLTRTVAGAF